MIYKSSEPPNEKLEKWMKTHLIMDLKEFGVWNDNYEKFFRE